MESEDEMAMDAFASIGERISEIENSLSTDEYNVARYLDNFNKKVKPLLVCFDTDIRDRILLDIVKIKDKETKKVTEKLKDRVIFTKAECELVSGIPFKDGDQDSYEDLMRMEDKEIKFWDKVDKLPNNMEQSEWDEIRADYHERMRIAKIEGVAHEKETLDEIFKHLEVKELNAAMKGVLPAAVFIISDILNDGSGNLVSRKWNEVLCNFNDIFKYETQAVERYKYYKMVGNENDDNRYEQWLDYLAECKVLTGETISENFEEIEKLENKDAEEITKNLIEQASKVVIEETKEVKKKKTTSEDGDEDDDDQDDDEELKLDDEFDDTFGEMPDGYVVDEPETIEPESSVEEVEEDDWGF